MVDFKAGDRVRVVSDSDGLREIGAVGTVDDVSYTFAYVSFDTPDVERDSVAPFFPHELERVEDGDDVAEDLEPVSDEDVVNHPAHYTAYGAEVIDITEHLNFCRGNAVKYIARAGLKDPDKELEDLEKALWCLNREIARMKGAAK